MLNLNLKESKNRIEYEEIEYSTFWEYFFILISKVIYV